MADRYYGHQSQSCILTHAHPQRGHMHSETDGLSPSIIGLFSALPDTAELAAYVIDSLFSIAHHEAPTKGIATPPTSPTPSSSKVPALTEFIVSIFTN